MSERDTKQIIKNCTRFLRGHYLISPHEMFNALAEFTAPDLSPDMYGQGELINNFEAEIAALLGKEAAVFMPSGTMAQQIALRIWAERKNNRNVAFHPTCHLETHEFHAYRELHHLSGLLVGNPHYLMTIDDLKQVKMPIGSLLIELPQREIGGILPTWDELTEITTWAREQGITLHLDGARLWESQPFYERPYAEICELFDSVYVSFYKILGGISGAALAGDESLIAEAKVWQRRHGGNLWRLYPFVLSAKMGLEKHLPKMKAYCDKAREIAAALSQIEDIEIKPNPPHCNMMHVYFRRDPEQLWNTVLDIAEETQTLLMTSCTHSQIPAYSWFELTVGDAALDLSTGEIATLFTDLMRRSI